MSTHVTGIDLTNHLHENFEAFSLELKQNEVTVEDRLSRYQDVADARLDSVNHDITAILKNEVHYDNVLLGTTSDRWKVPPKANITTAEYRGGVIILNPHPL